MDGGHRGGEPTGVPVRRGARRAGPPRRTADGIGSAGRRDHRDARRGGRHGRCRVERPALLRFRRGIDPAGGRSRGAHRPRVGSVRVVVRQLTRRPHPGETGGPLGARRAGPPPCVGGRLHHQRDRRRRHRDHRGPARTSAAPRMGRRSTWADRRPASPGGHRRTRPHHRRPCAAGPGIRAREHRTRTRRRARTGGRRHDARPRRHDPGDPAGRRGQHRRVRSVRRHHPRRAPRRRVGARGRRIRPLGTRLANAPSAHHRRRRRRQLDHGWAQVAQHPPTTARW
ncbi:hypothetical protein D7316_00361 [Gordonia insulae]|uniref:Uncharacterized protein n=1 Tax=Gordonia insulae TaxID=2420509 RepID=A0A3G8JGY9_9ACTN|nr:hypothetical protein D7316_00361 [Gordonia insulae]